MVGTFPANKEELVDDEASVGEATALDAVLQLAKKGDQISFGKRIDR